MKAVLGGVYKTQFGKYLRLDSISELLYFFSLVDENNVELPEQRNRFGHVVVRNKVSYTLDVFNSFKRVKINE
jgi:hypothetical protein